MQYHGVWDKYEMYDVENDPDEMHNLLGDFVQTTESGPLEGLIRRQAAPEIRAVFDDLHGRLMALLEETGARPEPRWGL